MPSPVRLQQYSRTASRVLRVALHVASLGLATAVAGAQDSTTAARPAAATALAPAKDSVRKDSVKAAASVTAAPASTLAAPAPRVVAPSTAPSVTPAGAPAAAPDQPDLANVYVQRAVSLVEMGRDDEAIAQYRKGIANDPLDSDTWYGLAELLHDLGRDKQAIETYTLALSTIEHAPELRLPFAELLMANRRKPEAIKVLQRGIELDPDYSADLKMMLGNVILGALDDSMTSAATDSVAKAGPAKPKPRVERKKRKKLCKLFCPGTLDPAAPKP